jgi:hypothetical protein
MSPHVPYLPTKFGFQIQLVCGEIKKTNLTRGYIIRPIEIV